MCFSVGVTSFFVLDTWWVLANGQLIFFDSRKSSWFISFQILRSFFPLFFCFSGTPVTQIVNLLDWSSKHCYLFYCFIFFTLPGSWWFLQFYLLSLFLLLFLLLPSLLLLLLISYFGSVRCELRAFVFGRQVFYCLSHTSSLFWPGYFGDRVSLFCSDWPESSFSYLCFLQ
jgi:hypothetical protein